MSEPRYLDNSKYCTTGHREVYNSIQFSGINKKVGYSTEFPALAHMITYVGGHSPDLITT